LRFCVACVSKIAHDGAITTQSYLKLGRNTCSGTVTSRHIADGGKRWVVDLLIGWSHTGGRAGTQPETAYAVAGFLHLGIEVKRRTRAQFERRFFFVRTICALGRAIHGHRPRSRASGIDKIPSLTHWHIIRHRRQRPWAGGEGVNVRRCHSMPRRRRMVTEVPAHVRLDIKSTTTSRELAFVR
jgi:hypothetical protein